MVKISKTKHITKKGVVKRNPKQKKVTNREIKKLDKVPKGWRKTIGATTTLRGYEWYSNGESRFSGKRKIALVKKR